MGEKDSFGNIKQRVLNPKRRTFTSHAYHFRSPAEMGALFSDIPEALAATLEIAEKCHVEFDFKTKHYPVFTPPGEDVNLTPADFLVKLCNEGISRRYTPERLREVASVYPGKDPLEVVKERLKLELSVIILQRNERLLADRLGFYPLGQNKRHPDGSWTRFRGRLDRFIPDWSDRY